MTGKESALQPLRGIFVTGTDTGVGKTVVGAMLVRALVTQGVTVRPRKPVETGCAVDGDGNLLPADALALWAAAGEQEPLDAVCPFRFSAAFSPRRAAALAEMYLGVADLEESCRAGRGAEDFLLVEGAGGLLSPLATDGLNADLVLRLGLPLLIVVPDRLGSINHALLTLEAARARGLAVAAIVLNRGIADNGEMDNTRELASLSGMAVIEFPHEASPLAMDVAVQLAELMLLR